MSRKFLLLYLIPISLSSFSCANQKEKQRITIKEAIADAFYEMHKKLNEEFLKRHPDSTDTLMPKDQCYPEKYLGHKDNLYVVSYRGHQFREYNIQIDTEYISNQLYFGPYGGPWVFQEGTLMHFNDAFCDGIIDLDFVKTFDTFQQEHTVDELDEVYIEL